MSLRDAGLAIAEGLAGASGDPNTAARAQAEIDKGRQAHQDYLKFQMAPLQLAISADQQRLSTMKEDDPARGPIMQNMAVNIGRVRNLFGDKTPSDHPGRVAETVNGIRQFFHAGGKSKEQLQAEQDAKVGKFNAQNATEAGEYASGAYQPNALLAKYNQALQIPGITPEQALMATIPGLEPKTPEEKFIVDYRARNPKSTMEDAIKAYTEDTNKKPQKPLRGWKILDQGGIPYGVMNQDTGQQVLAGTNGELPNDAPAEAGTIWGTVQAAIKAKAAEREKADAARDKRLASTLGNLGSWTIAEDGSGETVLYNSKTGQTKSATPGLHRSGYFAKQIAPIQAAAANITEYMKSGVFDGPGDLALQHEFFTATQPSTGFRMTKVQQDILQNSRSWLDSWRAKALHATTGQWFTEAQRKQLADAAQQAIAAKIKALEGSDATVPEGPKTKKLKEARGGSSPKVIVVTPGDMQ